VTDFRGLLATLRAARVDFLIVGGVAATLHGSARLTSDLDIVYAREGMTPTRKPTPAVRAVSGPRRRT
jgi:hypothetical protein